MAAETLLNTTLQIQTTDATDRQLRTDKKTYTDKAKDKFSDLLESANNKLRSKKENKEIAADKNAVDKNITTRDKKETTQNKVEKHTKNEEPNDEKIVAQKDDNNNEANEKIEEKQPQILTGIPDELLALLSPVLAQPQTQTETTTTAVSANTATVWDVDAQPESTEPVTTVNTTNTETKGSIDLSKLTEALTKTDETAELEANIDIDTNSVEENITTSTTPQNTTQTEDTTLKAVESDIEIESIDAQKTTTVETPKQENSNSLKSETSPLDTGDDAEVTATSSTQNTSSDSTGEGNNPQNNTADIKLTADNLSEKSAFLESDKSIIFNKVLDGVTSSKPVQKTDVLNQINQNLSQLSKENAKVSIILRPENLGRITVELQSGKDGLIAKFATENPQVRDILDKSMENLKSSLAAQGVQVNNIVVKVENASAMSNQNMSNFTNENFDQNMQTNSQNQSTYKSETKQTIENTNEDITQEDLETTVESNTNRLGKIDYRI